MRAMVMALQTMMVMRTMKLKISAGRVVNEHNTLFLQHGENIRPNCEYFHKLGNSFPRYDRDNKLCKRSFGTGQATAIFAAVVHRNQ